jgi:hypothetical protein
MGPTFIPDVDIQLLPCRLLKRLSFLQYMFLSPSSKVRCLQMYRFTSMVSVLSIGPCVCFDTVLCCLGYTNLQCILKSVSATPPAVFFAQDYFIYPDFYLWFHTSCGIVLSSSVKSVTGVLVKIALTI